MTERSRCMLTTARKTPTRKKHFCAFWLNPWGDFPQIRILQQKIFRNHAIVDISLRLQKRTGNTKDTTEKQIRCRVSEPSTM